MVTRAVVFKICYRIIRINFEPKALVLIALAYSNSHYQRKLKVQKLIRD